MPFKLNPLSGKLDQVPNVPVEMAQRTMEPTGFKNNSQSNWNLSYDETTRQVTLTPLGGTQEIDVQGITYFKSAASSSVAHDNAEGSYFFQIKADGTYEIAASFDFTKAQLSVVKFDPAQTPKGWAIRELHGNVMDWATHYNLHNSQGTFRLSGGTLDPTSYTVYEPSSATNPTLATITPAVVATTLVDEDVPTNLLALPDGGPYNVFRLQWTSAKWDWTTGYASDAPAIEVGNVPYYNPASGGDSLVALANDDYFCVYCVAIPVADDVISQTFRYIWVLGQQKYTPTLPNAAARTVARDAALAEDPYAAGVLILSPLPSQEYVIVQKLVYHYNTTFTNNAYRLRLEGVQTQNKTRAGSGSAVVSLPSLFDSNISVTTTTTIGNLDPTAETNQKLVNERFGEFGMINTWATGKVYRVGNAVRHDHKTFQCATAHTSGIFDTDNAAGYWVLIGSGGLANKTQTTDSAIVQISSNTIPSNVACTVTARVSAFEPATGDSKAWVLDYHIKNVGGTCTATLISERANEDAGASGWAAYCDVSGTSFRVNVKGETAKTVNWNSVCEHSLF